MRIVFMGTPRAAVPALRAVAGSHEVAAVYTKPDRRRGRGLHVLPPEVKVAAGELGLPVIQPKTLKDHVEREGLAAKRPEVIVVVAFGRILPSEVLTVAAHGCVNLHFSLLPRWRGAAPVERAIAAGDPETGVTTMLLDEGLDTGPILLQRAEPIAASDTAGALTERLAITGAGLMLDTLAGLENDTLDPRPQPEEGATYAQKVERAEAELDLTAPAGQLERLVRAFDPSPGASVRFRGKVLKVWRASVLAGGGEPATFLEPSEGEPVVQTGHGRLRLHEVQPEGKRRMTGAAFVRGYRPEAGESLGVGA